MAKLYNWRYEDLGDLPSVTDQERFRKANAGLAYDYQFIGTATKDVFALLARVHPCCTRHAVMYTAAYVHCFWLCEVFTSPIVYMTYKLCARLCTNICDRFNFVYLACQAAI